MEKNDILEALEIEKNRMNRMKNRKSAGLEGLSGTITIMTILDALIYIVGMVDKEAGIDVQVAAVESSIKKPKKEPKEKKKTVDYGKIVALHQAGWSQKKIADEMGVSANAICVSLKRYKEKLEDGFAWDPEERKFIKKGCENHGKDKD